MSYRLTNIAAFCVGLASTGCMQTTDPIDPSAAVSRQVLESPPTQMSAATPLLNLRTSVDMERTVVAGSSTPVFLTVTNLERESVTLRFSDSCQLEYEAFDWQGNEVDECCSCFFFMSTLTLAPGETVRQRLLRFHAARWDDRVHGYVPLPPGQYRFRAYLKGHGYYSPPFIVRVVEARF